MLKKPLSFEKQVERLKEHNIIIKDPKMAQKILSTVSYYRLSGYALPFRSSPSDSTCIDGTSFESIYRLYCFDHELRTILRRYLEIEEVYYKTQIAHWFSMIKCTKPPYDQHYNKNNYYRSSDVESIIQSFGEKEREYYKDSLIVKHHNAKYGGKMPLWAILELLTFSNASKLYSTMYASDQNLIASHIGVSKNTLKNHLHCMAVLRNKCSHGARLYNTNLYPSVKLTPTFLKKHPDVKQNTVFSYVLMIIKRLPYEEDKIHFKDDVFKLINDYIDVIDFALIGFPPDYESILINNC